MYLKSITVQGFKSFPDKTTINFTDGITAIVGPNGSGKSNIVDAIRWVLGEQSSKTLRGSSMADVIFNGTSQRKQSGFAEVTLLMDNEDRALPVDLSEVAVTRRLYRTGESEYFLCDKPARLKDITEIFMNTGVGKDGYSIIGQGKIAEVLAAKSEERRNIFEEAAGISLYRYRKNETERKLANTQDNLLRVHDIVNELESRIGPLKSQSEKAKAFLSYSGEKKQLEINVWLDSIDKTNESKAAIAEKLASAQELLDQITRDNAENLARIDELTELVQQKNVELDELRVANKDSDDQLAEIAKERAVTENEIRHEQERIDRIRQLIASDNAKFVDFDKQIADKRKEQDAIRVRKAELQNDLQEILAENERQLQNQSGLLNDANRLTAEIAVLTGEATDAKIEIASCRSKSENESEQIAQIDADIAEKEGQIAEQRKQMAVAKQEYDACQERINENENVINGYRKKLENKQSAIAEAAEKARKAENDLMQKTHRRDLLVDMEKQKEGFAGSVKAVMREASHGTLKNIYGTINDLITVKNEYSVAIETALGGAIQNIVVESEADAKAAMLFLKRENAGRATFLPLSSAKDYSMDAGNLAKEEGFVGVASTLLTYDKKYDRAIRFLLGKTVVVDNIDDAIVIAKKNAYSFRIVTLDGQLVNAGGSFTGGSQTKGSGVLSRKNEISELETEIEKLTSLSVQAKKDEEKIRAEEAAILATLDGANAELNVARENGIRAEGTVNQYKVLISALNGAIDDLDQQKTDILAEGSRAKKRIAELETALSVLQNKLDSKNREFEKATKGQQDAALLREKLTQEISEKKMACGNLDKDVENIDEWIAKIEEDRRLMQNELADSENEIHDAEQKIAELQAQVSNANSREKAVHDAVISTNARFKETEQARNEAEATVTALRKASNEIVDKREGYVRDVERFQAKKEQVDAEYDVITARLWDEYELTLTDAYNQRTELESVSAANKRISELRNKIKALGAVNVDAIQEYREVKERYDFLKAQMDDLEKSKADMEKMIADMTAKMRVIFAENFKVIRENFSEVFKELFGGGSASLELSDPTDVLESGIEIIANPPGKIIKSLSALSGGEQALTAVSLYFAIMKVRPAPFCLLDEIDAPLDDVNVTRLANYMKRLVSASQYICITHKRNMMEAADILYGVTMQERGVTKLLTINVADVERTFGNKLG